MSSDEEINTLCDVILKFVELVPALAAEDEREQQREDEPESSNRNRTKRRRRVIPRDRVAANALLNHHYFDEGHQYTDEQFTRRYRMSRNLFQRIAHGIENFSQQPLPEHFAYFQVGPDCTGKLPFTIYQKCTAALRQMAYGVSADALDEYLQMGEKTAHESLQNFCKCVYDLYKDVYLRKPTPDDIIDLYEQHSVRHGLPGMLGSIDCMHWAWRNCPNGWRGQYTRGDKGHPTIMLEAVASQDLWIWHAFFGVAGSNNDINVLHQSPLFRDLVNDRGHSTRFEVNGKWYEHGYYLADGIYPEWATFVKSFSAPQDDKRKLFKRIQEGARKDIERAFGVLQGRWTILQNPARPWSENKIKRIMYTCIILHNMIIEERDFNICPVDEWYETPTNTHARSFAEQSQIRIQRGREMRHRDTHHNLRADLTEHIWGLNNN